LGETHARGGRIYYSLFEEDLEPVDEKKIVTFRLLRIKKFKRNYQLIGLLVHLRSSDFF